VQREGREPRRELRPVDEGEPLFRLEDGGGKARRTERLGGRQELPVPFDFAFPYEGEREMRERREIPRRADRAPG
jgi:hypothetical protein